MGLSIKEGVMVEFDQYPKKCNLCGGYVKLVTCSDRPYYKCYRCGAKVYTHPYSATNKAIVPLANEDTRKLRSECHVLLEGACHSRGERTQVRMWLASKLKMKYEKMHFAYMTDRELRKAIRVIKQGIREGELREEA